MTTKLTLTLDDKVIQEAKQYARAKGRSVSELVESYFKSLTEPNKGPASELTPAVKSLMGSFKAPAAAKFLSAGDKLCRDSGIP